MPHLPRVHTLLIKNVVSCQTGPLACYMGRPSNMAGLQLAHNRACHSTQHRRWARPRVCFNDKLWGRRKQRSNCLLGSTGVLYLLPGPTRLNPDQGVQHVQMQTSHIAGALTDLARMLSHAKSLPQLCTWFASVMRSCAYVTPARMQLNS